jgi:replicative DNA helicase
MLPRTGRLSESDFFNPRHRVAFEAVKALYDRGDPVDPMTLEAQIAKGGMLEAIGGLAGISSYMLGTVTADNVPHYAAIVRDQSFARRLKLATSGSSARLTSGADWKAELTGLRSALESLEEDAHDDPPTLKAVITDELKAIRSGRTEAVGLLTGLGIERVCPTGIPLDKVTTIVGETGNFKTTLASNLAWNMAKAGNTVLHISWEDSSQLEAQRAIGRSTGIAYGRLAARTLDASERLRLALGVDDEEISERIIAADNVEPNIDTVIRLARYFKRTKGCKVVILDYIQQLDGAGTQKQILDDAVQKAQRSAKRDRIAYIFVSQAKAELTGRKDEDGGPRPTLDDCLGSSAMRIGTKLGIGVFRPWKYCRIPTGAAGPYGHYSKLAAQWPAGKAVFLADVYPRILEIGIVKNVLGESSVKLLCLVELETGRITPLDVKPGAPSV